MAVKSRERGFSGSSAFLFPPWIKSPLDKVPLGFRIISISGRLRFERKLSISDPSHIFSIFFKWGDIPSDFYPRGDVPSVFQGGHPPIKPPWCWVKYWVFKIIKSLQTLIITLKIGKLEPLWTHNHIRLSINFQAYFNTLSSN